MRNFLVVVKVLFERGLVVMLLLCCFLLLFRKTESDDSSERGVSRRSDAVSLDIGADQSR